MRAASEVAWAILKKRKLMFERCICFTIPLAPTGNDTTPLSEALLELIPIDNVETHLLEGQDRLWLQNAVQYLQKQAAKAPADAEPVTSGTILMCFKFSHGGRIYFSEWRVSDMSLE